MQLKVVKHCVVSDCPIVNFGPSNYFHDPVYTGDGDEDLEIWGQDKCTMDIIFTCRSYLTEGWKIFWSQNKFIYASIYQFPFDLHSSMDFIQHLSLRLDVVRHDRSVTRFIEVLEGCEPLQALKKLQIHIITDPDCPGWAECDKIQLLFHPASCFYQSYQQTLEDDAKDQSATTILGPNSSPEALEEDYHPGPVNQLDDFVIDGLASDVMRLNAMFLRLASTAVNPSGRIGLGIGEKGRSYYQKRISERDLYEVPGGPELTWIRFGEVNDWITEHAKPSAHITGEGLTAELGRLLPPDVSTTDPLFDGWSWA